jgi:hypothetical protein
VTTDHAATQWDILEDMSRILDELFALNGETTNHLQRTRQARRVEESANGREDMP